MLVKPIPTAQKQGKKLDCELGAAQKIENPNPRPKHVLLRMIALLQLTEDSG